MSPSTKSNKDYPVFSGVLQYFPDAIRAVAEVSRLGSLQHHPDEPMHWDRAKSGDEADALVRHLMLRGQIDADGARHTAKVAWRALALLQKEIEEEWPPENKVVGNITGQQWGVCVCGGNQKPSDPI